MPAESAPDILRLPYLFSLSSALGFMEGVGVVAHAVAADGDELAPLCKARQTLYDYSTFLLNHADLELLRAATITDTLNPFVIALSTRVGSLPTSAYVYYNNYGYLGFDDVEVMQYASQRTITQLSTALQHLDLIEGTGAVPSGSASILHPIPGIQLVVTVPGYPEPVIPEWIALTIRLKIEVTLILTLATKLIRQEIINTEGSAPGFNTAVAPFHTEFAENLRDFDEGTIPKSSLGSPPGSSGGSASSKSGPYTVAPPAPAPGSSNGGGGGSGGPPGSGIPPGSGGPPPGGSSSSDPRRNIVLIGMWPPSCDAVSPFCQTSPTPPGAIPGAWTGWQGSNWENRKFDIIAFCPTFTSRADANHEFAEPPLGHSGTPFRVDYMEAMKDFWEKIPALNPVAVIAVTMHRKVDDVSGQKVHWEFERVTKNLRNVAKDEDWIDLWGDEFEGGYSPSTPHRQVVGASAQDRSPYQESSSRPDTPPDSTRAAGTQRNSELLVMRGSVGTVDYVKSKMPQYNISDDTDAGRFVSNWIGYMCNWYADVANTQPKNFKCPIHGSIHIHRDVIPDDAKKLMWFTLDHLTHWLNEQGYP